MWSIHPMGLTTICMMSENEFSQVGQGKSWPSLQITIIKLSAKVFSSSISLVWWDETFLFEVSQGFCNNVTCLPYLTYRYTYTHCYILIFGLREKQCCLRTLLVFFHFLYHINPILDGQYHYSYTWHINLIKKTSPKMLLSRHWLLICFLIFIKTDESNHFQMPLNQIKHAVTHTSMCLRGHRHIFWSETFPDPSHRNTYF